MLFSLFCHSYYLNTRFGVDFNQILDKKLEIDNNQNEQMNRASITNKFKIVSANPTEIHINGGDEVELVISHPKSKEVYCKVGLKVFKGLNIDNTTMVCKLPLLSRHVFEDQDSLNISLSFDQIHWCMPYSLRLIQPHNQLSFLAILSYLIFLFVLGISLKMIIFDAKQPRRRKPPKKKDYSAEFPRIENDDNKIPYRKVLNDSFL